MIEPLSADWVDSGQAAVGLDIGDHVQTTSVHSEWLQTGEMRFDASYFSAASMQALRLVFDSGYECKPLNSLVSGISYPTRFKRVFTTTADQGMPFLTPSEMIHWRPKSYRYLADYQDQLQKCQVKPGWLLITRSGSVGRCVMIDGRLAEFAISDDAIRVVSDAVSTGYLYAFLASWVGQALLSRDKYGATIKHLEPHHVSKVLVPILPEEISNEIVGIVATASSMRTKANTLLDDALVQMKDQLGLLDLAAPQGGDSSDEEVLAFQMSAHELTARLDASFHVPIKRRAIKAVEAGFYGTCALEDLSERIFMPNRFARTYVDPAYGVPFIQGKHIPSIRPYDLQFIARSETRKLEKSVVDKDWVLITRSGTVGRVGVVTDATAGWAVSEHAIRLQSSSLCGDAGYIALFLMSPYGQIQLTSEVHGAVVDELTTDDVGSVRIPKAPEHIRKAIGKQVLTAFKLKDEANLVEDQAFRIFEEHLRARNGEFLKTEQRARVANNQQNGPE